MEKKTMKKLGRRDDDDGPEVSLSPAGDNPVEPEEGGEEELGEEDVQMIDEDRGAESAGERDLRRGTHSRPNPPPVPPRENVVAKAQAGWTNLDGKVSAIIAATVVEFGRLAPKAERVTLKEALKSAEADNLLTLEMRKRASDLFASLEAREREFDNFLRKQEADAALKALLTEAENTASSDAAMLSKSEQEVADLIRRLQEAVSNPMLDAGRQGSAHDMVLKLTRMSQVKLLGDILASCGVPRQCYRFPNLLAAPTITFEQLSNAADKLDESCKRGAFHAIRSDVEFGAFEAAFDSEVAKRQEAIAQEQARAAAEAARAAANPPAQPTGADPAAAGNTAAPAPERTAEQWRSWCLYQLNQYNAAAETHGFPLKKESVGWKYMNAAQLKEQYDALQGEIDKLLELAKHRQERQAELAKNRSRSERAQEWFKAIFSRRQAGTNQPAGATNMETANPNPANRPEFPGNQNVAQNEAAKKGLGWWWLGIIAALAVVLTVGVVVVRHYNSKQPAPRTTPPASAVAALPCANDARFAEMGNACDNGRAVGNACHRDGALVCRDGHIVCTAPAVEPATEICGNGIDEDCDGADSECPAPVVENPPVAAEPDSGTAAAEPPAAPADADAAVAVPNDAPTATPTEICLPADEAARLHLMGRCESLHPDPHNHGHLNCAGADGGSLATVNADGHPNVCRCTYCYAPPADHGGHH